MDESFFQTLRQIQKKERTNASLARVGPDFYKRVHSYINKLKRSVGNDPFSDEHYLLKDSQRIATEICERREHKITDAAVMNIHRSYHLFSKSNPEFDLLDTTPLNLTEEEETLYFSLIDTLKDHRLKISLDKLADVDNSLDLNREPIANPFDENSEYVQSSSNEVEDEVDEPIENLESDYEKKSNNTDEFLDKLDEIKNAKVIDDEKYEDINKQIVNQTYPSKSSTSTNNFTNQESNNSFNSNLNSHSNSNKVESRESNSKSEVDKSNSNNSNIDVNQLYNEDSQFVNLDELDNNEQFYDDINYEPNPFEFDDLIKGSKLKSKSNKTESNESNLGNDKIEVNPNIGVNDSESKPNFDIDSKEDNKLEIKGKDDDKIAILMFKDIGPIVGVDEKVYGPFHSQDVVILPKINAEIFINTNNARLVNI